MPPAGPDRLNLRLSLVAAVLLWSVALGARQMPSPAPDPSVSAAASKPVEGIPVTSTVVQEACAPCHTTDAKGQMSRISFQRSTPEGWQDTIKRMVALNGLTIDPATAREVVKYLSDRHGLSPEEAKLSAFEAERRLGDFPYPASTETERACTSCHSIGRVIAQRRTGEEWDLVIAMHRGWYPLVDRQGFRRLGPVPRDRAPDGRPADTRHPVEKALDHLKTAFPLQTPEWSAWSASMRPARLEGTWALSGWEPGQGAVFGRVVISPAGTASDEFETKATYTYARSGRTVSRTGRAIVYTGFQWRGRSSAGADEQTALREVMAVERDWRRMGGRWFTGGYDELGIDVQLERIGNETTVLGTDRLALQSGKTGQAVKVFGANVPANLQPAQIDLGPGITVAKVADLTSEALTLILDVAANAAVGPRDLFLAGSSKPAALTVFDRVQAIKVTPGWNMARVGGSGAFPKQFAQFEAWGYHHGRDGKPDTPDDLKLDLMPAAFSLEEYAATYDDDDIAFVGKVDPKSGLFTPEIEGPNPKRSGERNNIGDVWVVASYESTAENGKPVTLRGRAHLLVTVPLYLRWDPWAAVGGTQ